MAGNHSLSQWVMPHFTRELFSVSVVVVIILDENLQMSQDVGAYCLETSLSIVYIQLFTLIVFKSISMVKL